MQNYDFSEKSFFVTGGAGFIGSNIVEFLINHGAKVTVYDNLQSGNYDLIKDFKEKGMTFIKGSTLDKGALISSLKSGSFECLLHFAANPSVSFSGSSFDEGLGSTFNVLDSMRIADVKNIIFPSSGSVYGNANVRPTPENYGPLKPISMYSGLKLGSEAIISSFNSIYGIKYNIFRLANAVGKNMTHGVAYDFVKKLRFGQKELKVLGNGTQKKNYIAIEDILNATFYIYSNSKYENDIFNLASDDQLSVKEIAELAVSLSGSNASITYETQAEGWKGDVTDNFISNKKLIDAGAKLKMNSKQAVEYTLRLLFKNNI